MHSKFGLIQNQEAGQALSNLPCPDVWPSNQEWFPGSPQLGHGSWVFTALNSCTSTACDSHASSNVNTQDIKGQAE
jgi:hypothetical protein